MFALGLFIIPEVGKAFIVFRGKGAEWVVAGIRLCMGCCVTAVSTGLGLGLGLGVAISGSTSTRGEVRDCGCSWRLGVDVETNGGVESL